MPHAHVVCCGTVTMHAVLARIAQPARLVCLFVPAGVCDTITKSSRSRTHSRTHARTHARTQRKECKLFRASLPADSVRTTNGCGCTCTHAPHRALNELEQEGVELDYVGRARLHPPFLLEEVQQECRLSGSYTHVYMHAWAQARGGRSMGPLPHCSCASAQCSAVQRSAVQCSAAQRSAAQRSAVQRSAVPAAASPPGPRTTH